ncbi:MAG: hypothetical protein WCJ35_23700 [Planctomycetota bacterium]
METTLTDRFAVVQDVYQLEDWQTAAALLTEILGLPVVTARQQARKSHGYLAANLSEELPQRLRDACAGQGIGVELVPQGDIIPVFKPVRMHQVWITEDALWLGVTGIDAKTSLGWNTLRLIAVTKTTKKELFWHWETTRGGGGTGPNLKVPPLHQGLRRVSGRRVRYPARRSSARREALLPGVELVRSLGRHGSRCFA